MIFHPELDGPFSVNAQDNRWNTTLNFYSANLTALAGYRTAPIALVRVWSGDNPEAPQWTIPLAFPDAKTAQTILLSCGAIDTDVVT